MPSALEDPLFAKYMREQEKLWPSTPKKLEALRFDAMIRAKKIESMRFKGPFPYRKLVSKLLAKEYRRRSDGPREAVSFGTITLAEFQELYPRLVKLTSNVC